MITAEMVDAGITRRSTNIERPSGPLWTSNCRSLEGSTITDSANSTLPLFVGFAHDETVRVTPKHLCGAPVTEWDHGHQKAKYQNPGIRLKELSAAGPTGILGARQTICHATAPKVGNISTRA